MILPAERIVTSVDELTPVAIELSSFIPAYPVWAFHGGMGAGKTTFIRIICESLGVAENVSSPTFSLLNEYYSERLGEKIYHFDFYRIEREQEAVDIGCEEYFESGNLCLIEWPEKVLNLLPHPHLKITLRAEDSIRRIAFSYD
jgi:tRNA threonylcarbamoyladenosine biosynthesis protein TsaE